MIKLLILLVFFLNFTKCLNEQKNLIFVMADDLNIWVDPYKDKSYANTPFFREFSKESIVFKNFHASTPLCNPSRVSTWYGLHGRKTNVLTNGNFFSLPNKSLFKVLKDNGYYNMGFGKLFHNQEYKKNFYFDLYPGAFVSDLPLRWPFNIHDPTSPSYVDLFNLPPSGSYYYKNETVMNSHFWFNNFVVPHLRGNYKLDKPFALFFGFSKPHAPRFCPLKYRNKNDPPSITEDAINDIMDLSNSSLNLHDTKLNLFKNIHGSGYDYSLEFIRSYKTCIGYIDNIMEKMMEELKNGPYANNTIVIFTSDHGYALGDKQWFGKDYPYKTVTQIPFFVKPAYDSFNKTVGVIGVVESLHKTVESLHTTIDIFPTILDLLNITRPNDITLHGKSFIDEINMPDNIPIKKTYADVTTFNQEKNIMINGLYYNNIWHWIRFTNLNTGEKEYELYKIDIDENEINNIANEKPNKVQWLENFYNNIYYKDY